MSGLGCKLLKKMGWTEGDGIGKSGTGIVESIKPRLKIGTAGVGFRESDRLCSGWWMDAFNKAAATATARDVNGECEVEVETVSKKQHQKKSAASSAAVLGRPYSAFAAASAVLRDGREEEASTATPKSAPRPQQPTLPPTLSDEQLLAACGGRTAHPAARFGLSLGGKLARVRAHDLQRRATTNTNTTTTAEEAEAAAADCESSGQKRRRKMSKRKRRASSEPVEDSPLTSTSVKAAKLETS